MNRKIIRKKTLTVSLGWNMLRAENHKTKKSMTSPFKMSPTERTGAQRRLRESAVLSEVQQQHTAHPCCGCRRCWAGGGSVWGRRRTPRTGWGTDWWAESLAAEKPPHPAHLLTYREAVIICFIIHGFIGNLFNFQHVKPLDLQYVYRSFLTITIIAIT